MFDCAISKTIRDRKGQCFSLESSFCTKADRLVLFGPSGSGKSLTLQAIAGLITPDSGHIRIKKRTLFDNAKGVNLAPCKRKVGIIFQDYALFPHMTVRQNVGFGRKRLGRRLNAEDKGRIDTLIEIFGLEKVQQSLPGEISGGQQQRTALARGLAAEPDLLLLDEPFSALDKPLRLRMHKELAKTLEQFSLPLILVTHDADEMEYFADTVIVYNQGAIVAIEGESDCAIDKERIYQAIEQAYAGC